MELLLWIIGSVLAVSLISLVGIAALFWDTKKHHSELLLLVSFAAGTLLGDAFLHLLPEAAEGANSEFLGVGMFFCAGFMLFLVLEKTMHWHHHATSSEDEESHRHSIGVMNLVGDGVHNLIDGMIIAGAYVVSFPAGVATTLAVVFHEIPQEVGDFGILLYAGFSKKRALAFNFITALTALVGALVTYFLFSRVADIQTVLLPVAAGGLLYIAASDLIPETKKETRPERIVLHTFLLFLGIIVMYALTFLE
jgi:zinc and cadmium transporter